jgi:peroxiredoxin
MSQTLADQTRAAVDAFMASLPPGQQQTVGAAFARLLESDVGAQAIRVGARAPDFSLPNAAGDAVRLRDRLAEGPVVLNFYRGGWCPFCNLEFKALHDILPEIRQAGAALIGVSPELPDVSRQTIQQHGLQFEVLSDVGNQIARDYGLLMVVDEAVRPLYQQWGIDIPAANGDDSFELPLPATCVIDATGTVRAAHVNRDYTTRMEPADILAALNRL